MSWSITGTGLRPAVRAKILAEQNIPGSLKTAIAEICDDVQAQTPNGIRIAGYGHSGGGFSSIGKLEVESVTLELTAPDKPIEAAAEAAA
jgi:hypothetical protein